MSNTPINNEKISERLFSDTAMEEMTVHTSGRLIEQLTKTPEDRYEIQKALIEYPLPLREKIGALLRDIGVPRIWFHCSYPSLKDLLLLFQENQKEALKIFTNKGVGAAIPTSLLLYHYDYSYEIRQQKIEDEEFCYDDDFDESMLMDMHTYFLTKVRPTLPERSQQMLTAIRSLVALDHIYQRYGNDEVDMDEDLVCRKKEIIIELLSLDVELFTAIVDLQIIPIEILTADMEKHTLSQTYAQQFQHLLSLQKEVGENP